MAPVSRLAVPGIAKTAERGWALWPLRFSRQPVNEGKAGPPTPCRLVAGSRRTREGESMATPRVRGTRRASVALLALVLVVSGLSAAFLPSPSRIAVAKDGQT